MNLDKIKSLDDASQREVFIGDNTQAALKAAVPYVNHLQSLAGENVQVIIYGADEEGNLDPSAWPTEFNAHCMVAILSRRVTQERDEEGNRRVKSVPYAIIVHPIPTLDALLADAQGQAMVQSVLEKELNHRAVRPLRGAENLVSMSKQMPVTVEQFAVSQRGDAKSRLLAVFNEYATQIIKGLKSNPLWARAGITKKELRRCLENAAYAEHFYGPVEEADLFETALAVLIQLADKSGADASLFRDWAETRNEQEYDASQDETEEEIDVDSMVSNLLDTGDDDEDSEDQPDEQPAQANA